MNRTYYIEHLGCAKNRVDAAGIARSLDRVGWGETSNIDEAELVIVNTCGFIEPAKRESIETTLELTKRFPDKRIVLSGCLAERYADLLKGSMTEVDGFFGNRDTSRFAEIVDEIETGSRPVFLPTSPGGNGSGDETSFRSEATLTEASVGYVKIAEGCDNCCSFCAIPLIRGRLRSRSETEIVNDVANLVERGAFEINLIAQDLASYGADRGDLQTLSPSQPPERLTELVDSILNVPGNYWLRLLYIHPDHFPLALLEIVKRDRRLLPYFDLPFQHVSPGLLKRMGRRGSPESYRELVRTIRSEVPYAVIRSTFLLGFPGESGSDRRMLERFITDVPLEWVGFFEYSPEEGTPAYGMRRFGRIGDRLSRVASRSSRSILERKQVNVSMKLMDRFVGRTLEVLVEEPIADTRMAIGRCFAHAPEVDGNVVIHGKGLVAGQVRTARIEKRNGIDLEAIAVSDDG